MISTVATREQVGSLVAQIRLQMKRFILSPSTYPPISAPRQVGYRSSPYVLLLSSPDQPISARAWSKKRNWWPVLAKCVGLEIQNETESDEEVAGFSRRARHGCREGSAPAHALPFLPRSPLWLAALGQRTTRTTQQRPLKCQTIEVGAASPAPGSLWDFQ